jgi:hypothetical protein
MGIEEYDYLYTQANIMKGYITALNESLDSLTTMVDTVSNAFITISEGLDTANNTLETAIAYINSSDTASAITLITNTQALILNEKQSLTSTKSIIDGSENFITSAKTTLTTANNLVNLLIPLITEAIRKKAGELNKEYLYKCTGCSINCSLPLRFIPLDPKFFPECFLDGDKAVNWVQVSTGTITP